MSTQTFEFGIETDAGCGANTLAVGVGANEQEALRNMLLSGTSVMQTWPHTIREVVDVREHRQSGKDWYLVTVSAPTALGLDKGQGVRTVQTLVDRVSHNRAA